MCRQGGEAFSNFFLRKSMGWGLKYIEENKTGDKNQITRIANGMRGEKE